MNATTFDILRLVRDAIRSVETASPARPLRLLVSFDVYFELKRVLKLGSDSRLTDLYQLPVFVSPKLSGFAFTIEADYK
jgi:hypothetical protein